MQIKGDGILDALTRRPQQLAIAIVLDDQADVEWMRGLVLSNEFSPQEWMLAVITGTAHAPQFKKMLETSREGMLKMLDKHGPELRKHNPLAKMQGSSTPPDNLDEPVDIADFFAIEREGEQNDGLGAEAMLPPELRDLAKAMGAKIKVLNIDDLEQLPRRRRDLDGPLDISELLRPKRPVAEKYDMTEHEADLVVEGCERFISAAEMMKKVGFDGGKITTLFMAHPRATEMVASIREIHAKANIQPRVRTATERMLVALGV